MRPSEINLLDLDMFPAGWPHHWFTHLRQNAPVYRHPEPDGPGFWVVSTYDDVVAVARDWATFSSAAGATGLEEPPFEHRVELGDEAPDDGNMLFTLDPPEHTSYRNVVSEAFRPRAIAELEDKIRGSAIDILDRVIAEGECDIVTDVATDLTARTLVHLLGLPMADRHVIAEWCSGMIDLYFPSDPEQAPPKSVEDLYAELLTYTRHLAHQRRRDPGEDLVTTLLAAEIDGQPLSERDVYNFILLLWLAGGVETRSAIANSIEPFVTHPDQYEILVTDPAVIDTALEESLRWGTSDAYVRRTVTADTQLRGIDLKAGDKVSIWLVSANRDENVFNDPFRFDVRRHPNPHVAFGAGRHFCLGAHLARLELKVLFEELTRRVSHIEAAGEMSWMRSNFERGVSCLPVRFVTSSGG